MRLTTVTVDRGGVPVRINERDFRWGVDRIWGEPAPEAAGLDAAKASESGQDEKAELQRILTDRGVEFDKRWGVRKLRELAQA